MMDLTAWTNSVIGRKYRLVGQAIDGDRHSNVISIHQKYAVPRFRNKSKVVKDFYKLNDSLEMVQDGLRIKATADGWMDSDCSLFGVTFYVVPNDGYINYGDNPELLQG